MLAIQVGVALGRRDPLVSEQLARHEEALAGLHRLARVGVAQVVESNIVGQPGDPADRAPLQFDVVERLVAIHRAWEHEG